MRVLCASVVPVCGFLLCGLLLCGGVVLHAQETHPAEPGTGSSQVTPASKAPNPVQQPDVRLDSEPHTHLGTTTAQELDAQPTSPGQGVDMKLALGRPVHYVTPAGMIARAVPGDPRMVYFALPHRSGDDLSATDRTVVNARQQDLFHAAAMHGYDLKQAGWMYQQGLCPQMQPDAEEITGIPAGYDGQGALLLHFVRRVDGRVWAFSAIVPRTDAGRVRVIGVARNSVENHRDFLDAKTGGAVVNVAMPPRVLRGNMEPNRDWIAASACIAELGGAYPHIPNEPYLANDEISLAPPPDIELELSGARRVIFTDRVDETHYVIWNAHIGADGRMLDATREDRTATLRPITTPPLPPVHALPIAAAPPVHMLPTPPSPNSGQPE